MLLCNMKGINECIVTGKGERHSLCAAPLGPSPPCLSYFSPTPHYLWHCSRAPHYSSSLIPPRSPLSPSLSLSTPLCLILPALSLPLCLVFSGLVISLPGGTGQGALEETGRLRAETEGASHCGGGGRGGLGKGLEISKL